MFPQGSLTLALARDTSFSLTVCRPGIIFSCCCPLVSWYREFILYLTSGAWLNCLFWGTSKQKMSHIGPFKISLYGVPGLSWKPELHFWLSHQNFWLVETCIDRFRGVIKNLSCGCFELSYKWLNDWTETVETKLSIEIIDSMDCSYKVNRFYIRHQLVSKYLYKFIKRC